MNEGRQKLPRNAYRNDTFRLLIEGSTLLKINMKDS
jgi:hypothetical protein